MTAPSASSLSVDLKRLLLEAENGQRLTLADVEQRLRGRGFALLMMLLAVPFLLPSIPGLSTPFGLAIMLMGARVMVGLNPWLPKFILERPLSPAMMERILRGLLGIARRMERFVRPRMDFLRRWPGMKNLIGFGITLSAFFLLLPLPIPFTNTFPALAILLLAAGMMERDGVCVLIGYAMGVLAWGYLGLWLWLGKSGLDWFTMKGGV